jgi:hypothetical protein
MVLKICALTISCALRVMKVGFLNESIRSWEAAAKNSGLVPSAESCNVHHPVGRERLIRVFD